MRHGCAYIAIKLLTAMFLGLLSVGAIRLVRGPGLCFVRAVHGVSPAFGECGALGAFAFAGGLFVPLETVWELG